MFLEKRVYQGSSGKVYPLPFTDRIAEKPVDRKWKAVWIENEFLQVLVLPEIGGRVHSIRDKTNGYDLIYNQHVIKPALVGLAGPWISGGIEFNWPQHHRPATFLPTDVEIEKHADGSKTVWCSDHDPMSRMKGMHGVCLHPGKAYVELKVRAYNRTQLTQTFLWWANVGTRVHEAYQSFFPPDVYYIADHAKRATSMYPLAKGFYYGVNYGERGRKGIPPEEVPSQFVPPRAEASKSPIANRQSSIPDYAPNDLSFYANIPTPCSYMCVGSVQDFFGGYDYKAEAGIVHIADHHVAPGKKQWTWGNHEFGYAWDRNLTEPDSRGEYGPYIELMAGVYTDNQPDFSFLQPGETKTWSQYWYPIRKIGPAQHAHLNAAVSLKVFRRKLRVGVSVTKPFALATIVVAAVYDRRRRSQSAATNNLARFKRDLAPDKPFVAEIKLPRGIGETDLILRVNDSSGIEIISYQPRPRVNARLPGPATEPPAPQSIASADELFITGLHLDQYRHATRCPTLYWREALRRDPLDSRCNNAMGLWHFKRGEFAEAEKHFRNAIERLTHRNPNPYDGEACYNLGLCLRCQIDTLPLTFPSDTLFPIGGDGRGEGERSLEEVYAAFYKATWNQAWSAAGYHALAEIDCTKRDWAAALNHLDRALSLNNDNLRARNLKVVVLRKLGRTGDAALLLRDTLRLDQLDWWARHLDHEKLACDLQTRLDIAHDYARAGLYVDAIGLLRCISSQENRGSASRSGTNHLPDQSRGAPPLIYYTLGWLEQKRGNSAGASKCFKRASALPRDYCFPSRLEEIAVLESAMRANPKDARAPYYLGNLFYDRRRHEEAIRLWERSAKLDPAYSVVWRNLGIGYFNVRKQPARARAAYDRAFRANPHDARLLYERDQLWRRLGESPQKRLVELERFPRLVHARDDLSVELCTLYNQTGRHKRALALASSRNFQPWEGGEGGPLSQHVRSHLALGRAALANHDATTARNHFESALAAPRNLGEAKHLLANQNDIRYWLGCTHWQLGDKVEARKHWLAAATFKGDFQEMSARTFSDSTYYSALSRERLGQKAKARRLLRELLAYARRLARTPAKIDYFATSLPTMLLFEDDLQFRQGTTALFLEAQARLGLGQKNKADRLLKQVLQRDPNHALASDLLTTGRTSARPHNNQDEYFKQR
jgi:tetratricopeptide (TPR) repeat protein